MSEVLLLPEEITIDPRFNVRRWQVDEESERLKINNMAASIMSVGQLDAVVAVPHRLVEPHHPGVSLYPVLTIGHRRHRAVAMINEIRVKANLEPLRLRVRLDESGGDHYQKAIVSNLHRSDYSPMELAALIVDLRATMSVPEVATYLRVSETLVTDRERLIHESDPATQAALHRGELSVAEALNILDHSVAKRVEILETAKRIEAEKSDIRARPGRVRETVDGSKSPISRASLSKAITEVTGRPQPKTRADILQFIIDLDAPAYGYPDAAVRKWSRIAQLWTKGQATDSKMQALFDQMTLKADKGTRDSMESTNKRTNPVFKKIVKKVTRKGVT